MKNALFAAVFAVASASTLFAHAEETPAPAATPLQTRPSKPLTLAPTPTSGGTPIGYKLLAGGVVVVAAGVWLKKKRATSLSKSKPKKSVIDVLGRSSLGGRNELVVVEVEGTRLLIGTTASSMQTLAVLQTPEGVVGELSPELPGEERYATLPEPAPSAPRVKTLREQLDEPSDDEDTASSEAEQLSDRVRSLLEARKRQTKVTQPEPELEPVLQQAQPFGRDQRVARPLPKAGSVPGQAKGLLFSMSEGSAPSASAQQMNSNLGDW